MKLMTKEIANKLPALYAMQHKTPSETPVVVKYFNPYGSGTWYITEFDGDDLMFGLCCIHEAELGYVNLSSLKELRPFAGLPIERDLYWNGTLRDAMNIEGY